MRKMVATLLLTGMLSAFAPIMITRGDRPGRDIDNPIVRFIKHVIRHLLPLDDSNNVNPPKP